MVKASKNNLNFKQTTIMKIIISCLLLMLSLIGCNSNSQQSSTSTLDDFIALFPAVQEGGSSDPQYLKNLAQQGEHFEFKTYAHLFKNYPELHPFEQEKMVAICKTTDAVLAPTPNTGLFLLEHTKTAKPITILIDEKAKVIKDVWISNPEYSTDCAEAVADERLEAMQLLNEKNDNPIITDTLIGYYDNAKTIPSFKLYYEEGQIVKSEKYHENGQLKFTRMVKCNSTHGLAIAFSTDGKKTYQLEYKLGKKHGNGRSYYDNGQIKKKIHFVNDFKDGEQYDFSENGELQKTEIYENGEKISEQIAK